MLQFVPKRCIWIVSAIWGKDSSRHLSPWALQESVDELSETLRTVSKVPLQVWTMHVVNVVNVVACRCFALLHVHLQRLYDLHRFTSFTYLYIRILLLVIVLLSAEFVVAQQSDSLISSAICVAWIHRIHQRSSELWGTRFAGADGPSGIRRGGSSWNCASAPVCLCSQAHTVAGSCLFFANTI